MLKRRSRIVSFRLSEEEYEIMMERCLMEGSRSLSDYARAAACRPTAPAEEPRQWLEMESCIQTLQNRVAELDQMVRRLTSPADDAIPLSRNTMMATETQ